MSTPGESEARFDSLDFLYMPSRDVVADLAFYRDVLGGEVVFAIEAFGARVAQVRLSRSEPRLLLADHLEGDAAVLVYRVADLEAAWRSSSDAAWRSRPGSGSRTDRVRRSARRAARDWRCTSSRVPGPTSASRAGSTSEALGRAPASPSAAPRVRCGMAVLDVNAAMGKVGLPAPLSELRAREWDAIVVGGGHNGLTAAAYLARAGRSVLVLERREQLGGACTLEQPFPDPRYLISPCAYVVGLLDGLVVRELELERHGYRVLMADPNLWCPLPDGTSVALFLDPQRTVTHLRENGFSERDIRGMNAYGEMFERLRRLLRGGPRDTWVGASPSRGELEELLGHDDELISVVFEESVAARSIAI